METPRDYHTVVKRKTTPDSRIHFIFDPPLTRAVDISPNTLSFIRDFVLALGGIMKTEGTGDSETITEISVAATMSHSTLDQLFNLLDRDGVCNKNYPKADTGLGATFGDLLSNVAARANTASATVSGATGVGNAPRPTPAAGAPPPRARASAPRATPPTPDDQAWEDEEAERQAAQEAARQQQEAEAREGEEEVRRQQAEEAREAAEAARQEAEEAAREQAEADARDAEEAVRQAEAAARAAAAPTPPTPEELAERERLELGRITAEYLIYHDVAHLEDPENDPVAHEEFYQQCLSGDLRNGSPNTVKYATTLRDLLRTNRVQLEQTAQTIKQNVLSLFHQLRISTSFYTQSDTWVYWDICKQYYLNANRNDPLNAAGGYRLANPFEDPQIRNEIIYRHFGWELYNQYQNDRVQRANIDYILNDSTSPQIEQIRMILRTPPPANKTNGELSSSAYGELGRLFLETIGRTQPAPNPAGRTPVEQQNLDDFDTAMRNNLQPTPGSVRDALRFYQTIKIGLRQNLIIPRGNYEVNVDINVETGGQLIIQPGTTLRFAENKGIVCNNGEIIAEGTQQAPITFSALDATKPWQNISIESIHRNRLRHCIIEGGGGRVYRTDDNNAIASIQEDQEEIAKGAKMGGGIAFINSCGRTELSDVIIRNCKALGNRRQEKKEEKEKHGKKDHHEPDYAYGHGGGIWNYEASPNLTNVRCENNQALFGGGIYINGGTPELRHVQSDHNTALEDGGGLLIHHGSPLIEDSEFEFNKAKTAAGMYIATGPGTVPQFIRNRFHNNKSLKPKPAAGKEDKYVKPSETLQHVGGGAYIHLHYDRVTGEGYYPIFEDNVFSDNHAEEGGGAYVLHDIAERSYNYGTYRFDLERGAPLQRNNTFSGNEPDQVRVVFKDSRRR